MSQLFQRSQGVKTGLVLLLILVSLFLIGCQEAATEEQVESQVVPEGLDPDEPSGAAQPLPAQEEPGPEEAQQGPAGKIFVDTLEVQFLEAATPQVLIQGNLSDGCTQLAEREVERQGNTFQVTLTAERAPEQMCTEALVPFEETVPLETMNLPAGEYTVNVNGKTETFTLETGSASQEVPFTSPEDAEAYYANEAKEALAQQQSVEPDEIQVESVTLMEGQEEVYSITLQFEGETYEYHGQAGRVLSISEPVAETGELPGEGLDGYNELVEALDATGAIVQPVEEGAEAPEAVFSPPGQVIMVGETEVYVYEYESEEAAEADAARISADGSEIEPGEGSDSTTIGWVSTPHFYRNGRFLILYLGDNVETLSTLQVVFGPQFAGGEVAGTAVTPEAEDVN